MPHIYLDHSVSVEELAAVLHGTGISVTHLPRAGVYVLRKVHRAEPIENDAEPLPALLIPQA